MSPTASWSTGERLHAPGRADLTLEPVEVLAALTTAEPASPAFRTAFATALSKREAVAPLLLDLLELLADAPVAGTGEGDQDRAFRSACVLALLAQMREPRAYVPLLRLLRRPVDQVAALIGWFALDELAVMLASVAGDRADALLALARNRAASVEARQDAMCALVSLVGDDRLAREALVEMLRAIRLELGPDDLELVTMWALCAMDIHPGELMPEIRSAFAQTLVDESVIELDEAEAAAAESVRSAMARLRHSAELMDDAFACAMAWHDQLHAPEPAAPIPPPMTVRRETPKIGRNDPCPCGSGKKYKKCCMAEA